MASHPDFVNYMAEQLREAGAIRSRKMFGEYGLYCDDVFFAVVCDDQLFVKVTPQGEAAFPDLPKAPPYEGARDSFLVEDVENREQMTELVRITCDMYPLYWTPSRGGIIMRYTYEYKRKCVELYREGKWPETPEGVSDKSFRDKVRLWVRAEDSRGPEALKHKNFNRNWTPEERLELVSQVMSGKSCVSVAIEAGIQDRLLYQWVQNYKTKGYNGLVEMKKGRPSKGVPQMKKEEARPLNESEREELIRLRAENEYIKAENEVIKKEIALREERHAAQLKARKQRSSKSCVKKDTN